MAEEYIKRSDVLGAFGLSEETRKYGGDHSGYDTRMLYEIQDTIESIPSADVVEIPETGIGDLSDGYHTFNGLYYQRMVLFNALVNAYNGRAWKSWKHEDGEPCFGGGWFIVGIDTPKGSYTYHYEDKYWNWFECEELPVAKHWDGHTEEDVTRLLTLPAVQPVVHGEWIEKETFHDENADVISEWQSARCSVCNKYYTTPYLYCFTDYEYCPHCGARMDGE